MIIRTQLYCDWTLCFKKKSVQLFFFRINKGVIQFISNFDSSFFSRLFLHIIGICTIEKSEHLSSSKLILSIKYGKLSIPCSFPFRVQQNENVYRNADYSFWSIVQFIGLEMCHVFHSNYLQKNM